ncbi:hypothetical protein [Actinoallomurus sp. NPDC052274]|uniref:hypothetical protein n=1 Tax=Actinoallomurus sp. NPDC052274 TaxID=3155420 RepID=UPI003426A429
MFELDRITPGSLPTFLRRWYGPPDRGAADVDPAIVMPDLLRDWYRLTSQWSVPLSRHNHFSAPEDLRRRGDLLVFWDENQGAASWATKITGSDPLVYENEVDEEDDGWECTGFTLSEFLVYVAASEAVYGDPNLVVNFDMDETQYESVVSRFLMLRHPIWSHPHPGWHYMAADNLLAQGGNRPPTGGGPERYWIMVSANDPKALTRLPQGLFD